MCEATGALDSVGVEVMGSGIAIVGGAKIGAGGRIGARGIEMLGLGAPIVSGDKLGAGERMGACGIEGCAHLSIYGCSNLIPSLVSFSAM